MAKKNSAERIWDIVEPIITDMGLTLWDVRYVKEGTQWYLRIFIDHPDGVNINHCEQVSRSIDAPLEEADPIEQSYILEVCSPGIERPLIRDEHFMRFLGADVMVKMIRPIEEIGKEFKGVLTDYNNGTITITDHSGENQITIEKKETVYIKLDDFD